jgi:maleylacetate reductase
MMPSVLRFNEPATYDSQNKLAEPLRAPGANANDTFGTFVRRLGLPSCLSEVGVTADKFKLIGENAMLSVFTKSNPRTISGPDDVVEILKLAA